MKMRRFIQGDVIIRQIDKLPAGVREMIPERVGTTKVLQQSEVTGHHHHFMEAAPVKMFTSDRNTEVLDKLDFTYITPNEGKYIVIEEESLLYHGKGFHPTPFAKGIGDHNALRIPKGVYEIDIVREYDYERSETRRVVD